LDEESTLFSGFLSAVPVFEQPKSILASDRVVLHVYVVLVLAAASVVFPAPRYERFWDPLSVLSSGHRAISSGVKRLGPQADHVVPSHAGVKNA
jgi:hypothetical protein